MTGKHLLYFFDQSDWQSRMPLAQKAKADGYTVTLALIGEHETIQDAPEGFNIEYIKTSTGRMNLQNFVQMLMHFHKALKKTKPDLLHAVTLKYAFISGLSALPIRNIRKIYTIAGLGYLFRADSFKSKAMRLALSPLLKMVLKAPNTFLIFQNPDDQSLMISQKFSDKNRAHLILGSGVDLERFIMHPIAVNDPPLIVMPTRLVREKGADIFVEAARLLKARGVNARFQIAGGLTKHNPSALSETDMKELTSDGLVEWLGHIDDMPALLSSATIVVYPSWYGEGIPRVLLEATAAGCPIITTDHPGCREAVVSGENGLLVPIKDAAATAEAIKKLLDDPALMKIMGQNSRGRAERDFDVHLIVRKTLAVYSTAMIA